MSGEYGCGPRGGFCRQPGEDGTGYARSWRGTQLGLSLPVCALSRCLRPPCRMHAPRAHMRVHAKNSLEGTFSAADSSCPGRGRARRACAVRCCAFEQVGWCVVSLKGTGKARAFDRAAPVLGFAPGREECFPKLPVQPGRLLSDRVVTRAP